MKLSAPRRFWIALAILPLIGGVALASGPAMFVCRGDSIARVTCCCPDNPQAAPAPSSTTPSLSVACCCELTQVKAPIVPGAETRISLQVLEQFVVAQLVAAPLASPPPTVRSWAAFKLAHSPPSAIPILLGKQSFLI